MVVFADVGLEVCELSVPKLAYLPVSVFALLTVSLMALASVPSPEPRAAPGTGNNVLAPTWVSFNLAAHSTQTFVLASSFTASSLYSWAAGLRSPATSFDQNIRWSIEYTYGEKETAFSFRWYAGEPDWLSLEFVTPASTSGTFVLLKITNAEATARTMEYTQMSRLVQSGGRVRSVETVVTGTVTRAAFSGLLDVVPYVDPLAADTLYIFNVRLYLINDPDNTQTVAWLWRCYRSTTDPATPSSVGQSRHAERWGDDSWTNLIWATRTAGSYCGLWINNWDASAQQFAWVIRYYTAGSVARVTEDSDEGGACFTILPGQAGTATTTLNLPTGKRYIGYGRVVMTQGLNGDVDHKTALQFGLLERNTGNEGVFQGYKVRFWTDFKSIYNPWVEGVVLSYSAVNGQDLYFRIFNADTVNREFCYFSSVVSF